MTEQFKLQKGLDLDMGAAPTGYPPKQALTSTVGLSGSDYPGVSFDLLVAEGDEVSAGQPVCVDRHRPEIRFVAAASGQVLSITLGARRRLETLVISVKGSAEQQYDHELASTDAAALKRLLLESGVWVGFRSRPFGNIPNPDSRPAAIFVTATDTNPLAADPATLLSSQLALFQQGADALLRLTDGPVYICQAPGTPLVKAHDRIKVVSFSGPHPSGLAGTHIHHLMPVSRERSVWQIGYQDLTAIGHLLSTGRVMTSRMLSLAGSDIANPTLITAPIGASLADLTQGQTVGKNTRLISGSILSGHEAAYLGRYDLQVTAIDGNAPAYPARPFWQRLLSKMRTASTAPTGATIPMEAFERAFPFDLLPVPMMRALAVGDIETAERLGCLELLEDDLALLSCLCPSGSDYGALLRAALNSLGEESANKESMTI